MMLSNNHNLAAMCIIALSASIAGARQIKEVRSEWHCRNLVGVQADL